VDVAPGLGGHTPPALTPTPSGGGAAGGSPAPAPSGEVRVLVRERVVCSGKDLKPVQASGGCGRGGGGSSAKLMSLVGEMHTCCRSASAPMYGGEHTLQAGRSPRHGAPAALDICGVERSLAAGARRAARRCRAGGCWRPRPARQRAWWTSARAASTTRSAARSTWPSTSRWPPPAQTWPTSRPRCATTSPAACWRSAS